MEDDKRSENTKNVLNSIPKAFVLFGRAFKNAKKDFWISIQVLFWVSLVLSIVFYFVEHAAQPEEYPNWWQAFVWTVTRYIGDPGHFSGNGPTTLVGRHIDSIIGILKILIFAVPAGLVANGFRKAMEDDRKEKHLQECREKIQKSFRRHLTKKTKIRIPSRYVSVMTLQAKKGMSESDVIETVSAFDEFRLRNLASTQIMEEHPQDRLVIELIPIFKKTVDGFTIERTDYGIKIDRQSNVTIVAPTAGTGASISQIAFYLAQFGGFNLISREFIQDVDEPVSYLTLDGEEKDWDKSLEAFVREEPLKAFVTDLMELSKGTEKWNIVVAASDNIHPTQLHFIHNTFKNCKVPKTTLDEAKLMTMYDEFKEKMRSKHGLDSDMDEQYGAVGDKNIAVIAGAGSTNNAFIFRMSYSVITWSESWTPVIMDVAMVFKQHLEAPDRLKFEKLASWETKGWGQGEGGIQEPPIR